MVQRKGIILAGGTGSRLQPITSAISKQLLPVYDKPMIYYSLTVLMFAGIREIAIISTPHDLESYKKLLGDGKQWGISFQYISQPEPNGIAHAYILAEDFLGQQQSALILGDNIFYGSRLPALLQKASCNQHGATIFGYHVNDPERYGIIEFSSGERIGKLIEKPKNSSSNYAITGLYFLDENATNYAKMLKPSSRGELEIIDLLEIYRKNDELTYEKLSRGYAWLDTGTVSSLLDASNYVRTLTERQGLQIGSPDEVAYLMGLINSEALRKNAENFKSSQYGQYLTKLANEP